MKKVFVNASRKYDILIGRNLLKDTGSIIEPLLKTDTVIIVCDDKVSSLYLDTVKASLKDKICHTFVFKNGEASKNFDTYEKLVNFMAEKKICRKDTLIALGGGVCGDMAGFAAATFLRGISFIQIPTTLLAQVDSSVGGKVAIDLPSGKNLVGAFYQPSLVICDCDTLNTLDAENYKSGMAEVIKYALIKDKEFYSYLLKDEIDMEYIIEKCTSIKSEVVNVDEFDTGERQLLNFGHTFGHAVEINSNFALSHGSSVAVGMCMAAQTAAKRGLCTNETAEKITEIIKMYNLPITYDISCETLLNLMLSDKKVMGKTINMILPREIGNCEIHPVETENLLSFIKGCF